MNELNRMAKVMSTMAGVPIRIYKGEEKLSFLCHIPLIADPFDLYEGEMSQFSHGSQIIEDNNYYYGIVSNGDIHMVIGPLGEHLCTKENNALSAARKLVKNDREAAHLKVQADMVHCMSIYQVIGVICNAHYIVCGTALNGDELDLTMIRPEDFGASSDPDLFDYYQKVNEHGRGFDVTAREELTEKLVLSGNATGLRHMLLNSMIADYLPKFHSDELDNAKASLYYAASAIVGSLSRSHSRYGDVDALRRKYYKRCEALEDTRSVLDLKNTMLIDFASRFGGEGNALNYSRITLDAIDFIEHNTSSPIDTSDVANELFVSRSRISTIFKRDTGTNLSDYIHMKKLAEAKEMLSGSSVSVGYIASCLAYRSQSHFTSVFKKFEGMTPKEYRRTHSENRQ